MLFNRLYYLVKPLVPWRARIAARRILAARQRAASRNTWPIDEGAGVTPPGWPGWPDGKRFALVLTHDVEGKKGLGRIERLMALERRLGFRSSFNLVPEEEYQVSDHMLQMLDQSGFEVGVHGLEHDGKLYDSKTTFNLKAKKINSYIKSWGAKGFRSPLMHHRLGWLHQLNIEYDSSTFDTDPFEPEPDGVKTIFPFWVSGPDNTGYVELPYTLAQDHTLFVLLKEGGIDIWKKKLDWIAQRGGMAMLNTHPDYLCFDGMKCEQDEVSVSLYEEFLTYVRDRYKNTFWSALPRDVNAFYRASLPAGSRNTRKRVCMVAYRQYESDSRVRRYAESLACRGDLVDVIGLRPPGHERDRELRRVSVYGVIEDRSSDESGKWSHARQLIRFLFCSSAFVGRRHSLIKYDVVHVQNIPEFLVLSALHPKLRGIKMILDLHDVEPGWSDRDSKSLLRGGYIIRNFVERLSAALSDHVIVSDQSHRDRLAARSVPYRKYSVFQNGVDQTIFYRRDCTRTDGNVVLLFPGSVEAYQGLDVAIRALGRLKDRVPNCELHLLGGGRDLRKAMEELASELDLKSRVRFCDRVSLEQVSQMMANADIGVVHKTAHKFGGEAYGTRIMEFMSQGIPVVASRNAIDVPCFGDETVCFFDSGDDRSLAEALLKVILSRDLRESLSQNGLDYATRNDWNLKKTEYLSLVDSLCAESLQFADSGERATA